MRNYRSTPTLQQSFVFVNIIFELFLTYANSSPMIWLQLWLVVWFLADLVNVILLYNITRHQLEQLQQIMNKAARISLNINTPHHYLHHSSKNYFSQLHWLPVYDGIIFKIASITFKTHTTSIPNYLCNLIQKRPNPEIALIISCYNSHKN